MHQLKHTCSESATRTHRHAAGPELRSEAKPVEALVARRVKRLTAAVVNPERARLKAMEDALLNALMDVHSNRDRALDRLLTDLGESSEPSPVKCDPFPLPQGHVDNDFDGMA